MNIPPTKNRHRLHSGRGEFALDAWKAWVAFNANELSWIALVGTAVVLAGLYTRW